MIYDDGEIPLSVLLMLHSVKESDWKTTTTTRFLGLFQVVAWSEKGNNNKIGMKLPQNFDSRGSFCEIQL